MYGEDDGEYGYEFDRLMQEDEDKAKKYIQALGPFEDELSTDNIAQNSSLRSEFASDTERKYFPEIANSSKAEEEFLKVRNAALQVWHSSRNKECTVERVKGVLYSELDIDNVLITRVVNYLSREGLINFGFFKRVTIHGDKIRQERKTVLIIGTGAAGIAAATQLQRFGFNVHLVEARDRVGGRVCTVATPGNRKAETGCDTLRDMKTSPIFTLIHQLQLETVSTEENQNVYKDGVQHEVKNKLIRVLYRNLRLAIASLKDEIEDKSEEGHYPSRQRLYEDMFSMIERNTHLNYYKYVTKHEDLERRKLEHLNRLAQYREVAIDSENQFETLPEDDHLARRANKYNLKKAMESFQKEWEAFEKCEAMVVELNKSPKVKQYMSPNDLRDYNFLLGFEELRAGAILEKLQFSKNTNEGEWEGPLVRVPTGLMDLFEKIVEKTALRIKMNHRVLSIDYTDPSVIRVQCQCGDRIYELRASYVISTIPNGVLKKTIVNDEKAPRFIPPLPQKKVEAIRSMGLGLINKVIMEFNYPFWNPNEMLQFGTVNPTIQERSVFVCWQSVPLSKVITGYYVANEEFHNLGDKEICRRACAVLRQIYPRCPVMPESGFVTEWHNDELAYGSGTFMSLRTEPHHFEDIVEPLKDENGKNRIYFAGEHTSAEHYGTLDGAWFSGIRAAGDLINDALGFDLTEERVVIPVKEGEQKLLLPVKVLQRPQRPQVVRNSSSFPSLAQPSTAPRPASFRLPNGRFAANPASSSNTFLNQPSTSGPQPNRPSTSGPQPPRPSISNSVINRPSTSRSPSTRPSTSNLVFNQPSSSSCPSTSQPSTSRSSNSTPSNSYSNFQFIANQSSFYDRPYIPPSSSSRRRQPPPAEEEDFEEHRALVPDPKRLQ